MWVWMDALPCDTLDCLTDNPEKDLMTEVDLCVCAVKWWLMPLPYKKTSQVQALTN